MLPNKRTIKIDSKTYYWMVKNKPTTVRLTVQDAETSIIKQLEVKKPAFLDDYGDVYFGSGIITPATVKEFISKAFKK